MGNYRTVYSENDFGFHRPKYSTLTSSTVNALSSAIESGKFAPFSKLPSEAEIGNILGVSRTTIREALRVLEERGSIVRRRGLGTFVVRHPIIKDLSFNFGITEMIKSVGHQPGTKYHNVFNQPANSAISEAFGIPLGTDVIVIERVRTDEGRPIVWSINTVPKELVTEEKLKQFEIQTQSIYDFYATILKVFVTRGIAELAPVVANTTIASRLDIPRGTPIMQIKQIDYDINDQPVMHSIDHYTTDPYKFVINRKGPN